MTDYLRTSNANTDGVFATSQRSDAMLAAARVAMADFLACDPEEVVFGANMTSLTFAISRSIGRELNPGDEIVVTRLDHGANYSPWVALEERGITIRVAEIHDEDCTLDMKDLARKITSRTKLVAVGYASNAVGSINNVREVVRMAHRVGAMAYIDAVHYAPHGPIDVRALDCDFLVCSSYKFFGPHMGVLYGKHRHLTRLQPYKVAANTHAVPLNWEWGTLNHECIAGITACVDYLADLGRHIDPSASARRIALLTAWKAIQKHERILVESLISGLLKIPGLKFYGITRSGPFRRSLSHRSSAHRRPYPASVGDRTRTPRLLHLGWQLLRAEPDRTSGCRERRRLSAHRPGALQHGRRGGSVSGRLAGDSTVIKTEAAENVKMREEFRAARVDLAAVLRWSARLGYQQGICNHYSFLLPGQEDLFLVNPEGYFWSEVTASSLLICDLDGNIVEGSGTVERTAFCLHAPIHRHNKAARAALHTHSPYATALCLIEGGQLEPVNLAGFQFYGKIAYDENHHGGALSPEEGDREVTHTRRQEYSHDAQSWPHGRGSDHRQRL